MEENSAAEGSDWKSEEYKKQEVVIAGVEVTTGMRFNCDKNGHIVKNGFLKKSSGPTQKEKKT